MKTWNRFKRRCTRRDSDRWNWRAGFCDILSVVCALMPTVTLADPLIQSNMHSGPQIVEHFPPLENAILGLTMTDAECSVGHPWDSPISVSFDRAMDPTTVDSRHVQLLNQQGQPVTITISQDSHGYRFLIVPHEPLVVGQRYTVVLSKGIVTDDQRRTPITPYTWHFYATDSRHTELVESLTQMQRVALFKLDQEIELTAQVVSSSAGIRDSLANAEFFATLMRYLTIFGAISDIPDILQQARAGNRAAQLSTANLFITGISVVRDVHNVYFHDDIDDGELVDLIMNYDNIPEDYLREQLKSPLTRFVSYDTRKTRLERHFDSAVAELPDPLPCGYPLEEIQAQGRMVTQAILASTRELISVPTSHGEIPMGLTSHWRGLFAQSQNPLQLLIRTKIFFTIVDGVLTIGGWGVKALKIELTPQMMTGISGFELGFGVVDGILGTSNLSELQEVLPGHALYSLPIELATLEVIVDDYIVNTELALTQNHTVILPPQPEFAGDFWDEVWSPFRRIWGSAVEGVSSWWQDIQIDLNRRWQDGRRSVEQWGDDWLSDTQDWADARQTDAQRTMDNWFDDLERRVGEWLDNLWRDMEQALARELEQACFGPALIWLPFLAFAHLMHRRYR